MWWEFEAHVSELISFSYILMKGVQLDNQLLGKNYKWEIDLPQNFRSIKVNRYSQVLNYVKRFFKLPDHFYLAAAGEVTYFMFQISHLH